MEDLIISRPSASPQTHPLAPVIEPIESCCAVEPAPVGAEPTWLAGAIDGSLSAAIGIEAALVV